MQIHWIHTDELSDEQREVAEARLHALAEGHSDLIDVRIAAHASAHHRRGDREIRIACQARGTDLLATRSADELAAALDEALDVFEREVRRLRDKRSDRSPANDSSPPLLGVVDRVLPDEGYGMILTDGGERVYFHRNAVKQGLAFERLAEGDRVALNIEGGEKGPQATVVCAPPPDAPTP
jgi:cold shock CspA family protein/ribosome-associated translation inhibitor RaiA